MIKSKVLSTAGIILLIILAIILPILAATSQTLSKDSVTCLPNYQLRQAMRLIDQGKLDREELAITRSNVSLMGFRLSLKDSTISALNWKDSMNHKIQLNYESRIANKDQQLIIKDQVIADWNKKYKRQKARTRLAVIGGILATAASIYFLK